MECPKCGKKIADDSRYCEFCGVRVYSVRSKWKKYVFYVEGSSILARTSSDSLITVQFPP